MNKDIVRLELGEKRGELALVLDRGTRRRVKRDASLRGQNERERRLPEPWRTAKESVVDRLPALTRRLDEHAQVLFDLTLGRRNPRSDSGRKAAIERSDPQIALRDAQVLVGSGFHFAHDKCRQAPLAGGLRRFVIALDAPIALPTAASASLRLYPMFTSAPTTVSLARARDGARHRTQPNTPVCCSRPRNRACPGGRPSMRSTVFLPTPLIPLNAVLSCRAIAS